MHVSTGIFTAHLPPYPLTADKTTNLRQHPDINFMALYCHRTNTVVVVFQYSHGALHRPLNHKHLQVFRCGKRQRHFPPLVSIINDSIGSTFPTSEGHFIIISCQHKASFVTSTRTQATHANRICPHISSSIFLSLPLLACLRCVGTNGKR